MIQNKNIIKQIRTNPQSQIIFDNPTDMHTPHSASEWYEILLTKSTKKYTNNRPSWNKKN